MSATFDSEMFAQYFALPVRDRLEQAPVVDVEGRPFKVLEFYAEDLVQLGEVGQCTHFYMVWIFSVEKTNLVQWIVCQTVDPEGLSFSLCGGTTVV